MSSIIKELAENSIIDIPNYDDVHREVIMGSYSYGCNDTESDMDIYAFCIPPKEILYPHLSGHIFGFDEFSENFSRGQYQKHHIEYNNKNYDITIYKITNYFKLCMNCNPNMIDSLFVPRRSVKFESDIGKLIYENRHIFLCKKAWHSFKGYAYAQMHKMKSQTRIGKRKETIDKFGYDVKFAYHVVRLINEVEQILIDENIILDRDREILKSIRRGEWSMKDIEDYFERKEVQLDSVYVNSELNNKPRYNEIKQLLLNCLEMRYGSI